MSFQNKKSVYDIKYKGIFLSSLIFFFLIGVSVSQAQNFAPVGATWHFKKFCSQPTWMFDCGYYKIEILKDTIIQGQYCTILNYSDIDSVITEAQVIIREVNKKVYFYENQNFKLLFDFNLNTGDTLTFSVPYNWGPYAINCGVISDTSKKAQVIIDSTSFDTIDGLQIKVLSTTGFIVSDSNFISWELGLLREKIGSENGFFGHSSLVCLGGFPGHFRCYKDSTIFFKAVPEECDYISALEYFPGNSNLLVFPNPASDFIRIDLPNSQKEGLEFSIINRMGQSIRNGLLREGKIPIEDLAPGFYFIEFTGEQIHYRGKFIKN
jgi:Secretion system C-terminal sorting domain